MSQSIYYPKIWVQSSRNQLYEQFQSNKKSRFVSEDLTWIPKIPKFSWEKLYLLQTVSFSYIKFYTIGHQSENEKHLNKIIWTLSIKVKMSNRKILVFSQVFVPEACFLGPYRLNLQHRVIRSAFVIKIVG